MPARRRRVLAAVLALLATALGALAWLKLRGDADGGDSSQLRGLRAQRDELRAELTSRIAVDAVMSARPSGRIAVGIPSAFAADLVRTVATRLLDRVVVHLGGIRVRAQGDLEAKVLIRRVTAGTWHLDLNFERIRAVLRPGEPSMDFEAGSERVGVELPVHVDEGTAQATVRFRWDSHRLANVVCRDFSVEERVSGAAVPARYRLRGAFRIAADGDAIAVRPEFEQRTVKVRVRPADETWSRVERALRTQDSFWRCGIAMDPEDVMRRLRELTDRGFDVDLPETLFREIRLPAALQRSLDIEGRRVELEVVPEQLRLTPRMLWYGADVRTGLAAPPSD